MTRLLKSNLFNENTSGVMLMIGALLMNNPILVATVAGVTLLTIRIQRQAKTFILSRSK